MKSYITDQRMLVQGKAWQVRAILSQWVKENGAGTAVTEFIQIRTRIQNKHKLNHDSIRHAVQMGQLDEAYRLAEKDNIHVCHLIQLLYMEGYVNAVKALITTLDPLLVTAANPPFHETAYIYAEILHDDGRYEDAASIFEQLAKQYSHMSRAHFGASSCYLHSAMNRLINRLELYRPAEEELQKIEKYLHNISSALEIIHRANWHTTWEPSQSQNKREVLQTASQLS